MPHFLVPLFKITRNGTNKPLATHQKQQLEQHNLEPTSYVYQGPKQ